MKTMKCADCGGTRPWSELHLHEVMMEVGTRQLDPAIVPLCGLCEGYATWQHSYVGMHHRYISV